MSGAYLSEAVACPYALLVGLTDVDLPAGLTDVDLPAGWMAALADGWLVEILAAGCRAARTKGGRLW
jgi:hypothetical protein